MHHHQHHRNQSTNNSGGSSYNINVLKSTGNEVSGPGVKNSVSEQAFVKVKTNNRRYAGVKCDKDKELLSKTEEEEIKLKLLRKKS